LLSHHWLRNYVDLYVPYACLCEPA
jgi:hypothetical protein